uniref:Secreted protein n=1 Tax=Mesocestoides corti TaxID=53468 RepID=A0A5K3FWK3_MESCO
MSQRSSTFLRLHLLTCSTCARTLARLSLFHVAISLHHNYLAFLTNNAYWVVNSAFCNGCNDFSSCGLSSQ